MIKILSRLMLLIFIITNINLKADEGMFLPMFISRLNYNDMKKAGLKLTPEEIYSINNSSLKDVVVNFSNFCTGEIISKNGLILTNHHCGYGAIADLSTPENDILKNGFWAKNFKEEKPAKGIFIAFLDRMDDVTKEVNEELNKTTSQKERDEKTKEILKKIRNRELEKNKNIKGIDIVVKSFFKDNEFYIFYYRKYTDIRLVGTPPSSIGKYGADIDNWMWPRHTGDFSMFRVYADKDGNPNDYSQENVPLKAKNNLKINLSGIKENDYTMILGYPGSTDRYLPSFGVNKLINIDYPIIVRNLGEILEVSKKYMQKDPAIFINYAHQTARFSNSWKNRQGMIYAIKKLNVIKDKEDLETKFSLWINSDSKRKEKYGNALNLLKNGYSYDIDKAKDIANYTSSLNMITINSILSIKKLLESDKKEEAKKAYDSFWENHNYDLEKELFVVGFSRILSDVNQKPNELNILTKNDLEKIYDASIFYNKENFYALINKFDEKKLNEDKLINIYISSLETLKKLRQEYNDNVKYNIDEGFRLYVQGLREMEKNKIFAPDANFTMRITYGNILSYSPRDAVKYNYYTTIDGVMEKYKKGDVDFDLPEKLIELYNKKDFGKYADKNGVMNVCFITNNDITGGNSGSPVLNAKGELIGTAFDGNWDAMSGDIKFNEKMQRTIICDIRYVLFIVEKLGNANNIISELDIAN